MKFFTINHRSYQILNFLRYITLSTQHPISISKLGTGYSSENSSCMVFKNVLGGI